MQIVGYEQERPLIAEPLELVQDVVLCVWEWPLSPAPPVLAGLRERFHRRGDQTRGAQQRLSCPRDGTKSRTKKLQSARQIPHREAKRVERLLAIQSISLGQNGGAATLLPHCADSLSEPGLPHPRRAFEDDELGALRDSVRDFSGFLVISECTPQLRHDDNPQLSRLDEPPEDIGVRDNAA